MYKMNELLKFIIVILTISIVILTGNRIILWLFLFPLTIYHFYKNKKILMIFDFILVLLLAFSTHYIFCLYIFKVLYLIIYLLTVKKHFNIYKKDNKSSKIKFYEEHFDKIVKDINKRKKEIYDEDVNIDSAIERNLERSYLQAKIRYYDIINDDVNKIKFNRIDILILCLSIIIFLILFILR